MYGTVTGIVPSIYVCGNENVFLGNIFKNTYEWYLITPRFLFAMA